MGSLFSGTPQTAPSYTASTTETPKWLQDAIYNQINWSQNIANMPYQAYKKDLVADPSAQQEAAWNQVSQQQGAYKPQMSAAMQGTQALAGAPGAETAAAPYFQQALAANPFMAAQGALGAQASMLGQLDYGAPVESLAPFVGQAASGISSAGAPVTGRIQDYLNPYTDAVTSRIAELGERNLRENLAPALGSQFIRAGQFGSRGMGEMGARTLRDLNESIMAQQSQALQQGYGQALGAAQTDAARQLQAAQQISQLGGQLSGAQQQALQQAMAGASQYGQMGQQLGALTGQQQQAMLTAAQQAGSLRSADLQRQQSALSQLAQQAQQAQSMGYTDTAALEAAGQQQQAQQQRELDSAYQQYQLAQNYPMERLNFLSAQVRGMAPYAPTSTVQQGYTTTFGQSPLSQLATGLSTGAGLLKLGNLIP
jgi:hypothetical protein